MSDSNRGSRLRLSMFESGTLRGFAAMQRHVRSWQILLKKSKIAKLEISRENTEQQAVADSHIPSRVAEGAC